MKTLQELRKEIDQLDEELLHVLAKRTDIVYKIGQLKAFKGLPSLDEKRRDEVLESITTKAELLDVPKDFIKKLYALIHAYSLDLQEKIK